MTINNLKSSIENKTISNDLIVFVNTNDSFLVHQYINELCKIKNLDIEYIDNVNQFIKQYYNILYPIDKNKLFVCFGEYNEIFDDIKLSNSQILKLKAIENLIIVTNKCDIELLKDYVVEIPKLEKWQIKDYVFSISDGVPETYLNDLLTTTEYDLNRIQMELDKLLIFPVCDRDYIANLLMNSETLNDLCTLSTFNLTNAIVVRDKAMVDNVLKERNKLDLNIFAVIKLLYNAFKNVINIQLSNNPTPQSTGLKENQFYAVRKNINHYTELELVNIIKLLTSIDFKIKSGILPSNIALDYVITNILGDSNK